MEPGSFCTREKLATFAPEGFTTPNILKIANWFTFTADLLDSMCLNEAHTTEQEANSMRLRFAGNQSDWLH